MSELRLLGILVSDRVKEAKEMQNILTKYGCSIKTRLGLHEASEKACAKNGFIFIELAGDHKEWDKLESELKKLEGVEVQKMSFKY
ncbi:MAG TPA: hypothetical protein PKK26_04565 [Candidatus Wallbacteria bacterium]|nr:hypothetical protein [Candidatus Wallbacteria bacterium]